MVVSSEYRKLHNQKYYQKNKEKLKQWNLNNYHQNKEQILEKKRQNYKLNNEIRNIYIEACIKSGAEVTDISNNNIN